MDPEKLIVLIDESSTGIDAIRRALGDQAGHFRVRRVADVPTALARIWGGGVDVVLMNLAEAGTAEDRLAPFVELHTGAQGVPIVILCASADESLAERAVSEGASDYLIRESYDVDLQGGTVAYAQAGPFFGFSRCGYRKARQGTGLHGSEGRRRC